MLRQKTSKLKLLRSILFSFIMLLTQMSPLLTATASAVDYCERHNIEDRGTCVYYLRQQGINFVDPFELNQCDPTQTIADGTGVGKKLFIIGDSLTVGMTSIGGLMTKLNEAGFEVDASGVSGDELVYGEGFAPDIPTVRSTSLEATGGFGIENTTPKLDQHAADIAAADTVVVALGTNIENDYENRITAFVEEIRLYKPGVKILWVNTYFKFSSNPAPYLGVNTAIDAAASRLVNFSVIDAAGDTDSGVLNRPDVSDEMHFGGDGYRARAEWLKDKLVALRPQVGPSVEGSGGTIEDIDPGWVSLWVDAAVEFGVDPAIMAAVFTSEHGGNFYPLEGDSPSGGPYTYWARPNGVNGADESQAAAGPFQIIGTTWDSLVSDLGESWPRSDRDDPVKSTRAAALLIKNIGGVPGLEPGGWDQPQGFKPGRSEVPFTAASVGARYNQGPAWHDNKPIQGNNDVEKYANNTAAVYERLKGKFEGFATTEPSECSGEGASAGSNGWGLPGEPNAMIYYSQLREESAPEDPSVTSYWGSSPYGDGTIQECGCGPTSFAMIVATLKNDPSVTPDIVAKWASDNGYRNGEGDCAGSSWWWVANPDETRDEWGVKSREITIEEAPNLLKQGLLIMVSVGEGSPFLSEGGTGHLLVMRAVTDNGDFLFADPSDGNTKRANGGQGGPDVDTNIFNGEPPGSSHTPVPASIVSQGLKGLFVVEIDRGIED